MILQWRRIKNKEVWKDAFESTGLKVKYQKTELTSVLDINCTN